MPRLALTALMAAALGACATFTEGTPPTPPTASDAAIPPTAQDAALADGAPDRAEAGRDAGTDGAGDGGRPSPTLLAPRVLFRFGGTLPCPSDAGLLCTRNEGTFGVPGRLSGAATIPLVGPPGGAYGPRRNAGALDLGSAPSSNAVDIPDATDLVPMGTSITTFTVAAWVKRVSVGPERELARIVSLAPEGEGSARFELGYSKDSETKLALSIDDALPSGKETSARSLVPNGVWTFVAVTYDPSLEREACFFTGSEDAEVSLVECVDYNSRAFAHASARFSVGNAANATLRAGTKNPGFPGLIDHVFVYLGAALDVTELAKVQRD